MSKHTPGPWKVVTDIDTWMVASCGDGLIVQSAPCRGDDVGFADADARLIAAAPEMLEALKDLHASGDCGHETPGVHGCFCEVIAKAEGREST